MTRIITALAAFALSLAALLLVAGAMQPSALAAPEAPAVTHIITDCSPANGEAWFDLYLNKAKSGDTILVSCSPLSRPAVITFTTEKVITKNLTISGTPLGSTRPNVLSGGGGVRLFIVNAGSALTLTGIVLEKGYLPPVSDGGACVRVLGSLSVLSSELRYCHADGSTNGGAIYADGAAVTIAGSTLYSNSAYVGGGLRTNYSLVTMTGGSLDSNMAGDEGAGLSAFGSTILIDGVLLTGNRSQGGSGGGLAVSFGDVTLRRSEFTGNSVDGSHSGGGLAIWDALVSGSNLTFTQNTAGRSGGAVYAYGIGSRLFLTDVLLSGNTASGTDGGGAYVIGVNSFSLLRATVGNNTAHGVGGGIFITGTTALTVTESRVFANQADGRGGGLYVAGSSGALNNNDFQDNEADVGGTGAGGGGLYLDSGSLSLNGNAFVGNWASYGGGIYNRGVLSLLSCSFAGNHAEGGGGLYNKSVIDSGEFLTFSGNHALSGGGLYSGSGAGVRTVLTDTTFADNRAQEGNGGGIMAGGDGLLSLLRAKVTGNSTTESSGGGVAASGTGLVLIDQSDISGNTADNDLDGRGGGIYAYNTTLSIHDSTITRNRATGHGDESGGGIYAKGSLVNMTNAAVDGNEAADYGAGLYMSEGTVNLLRVTISGNGGAASGGGIACDRCLGTWQVLAVSGNTARTFGGGLWASMGGVIIRRSVFDHNTAPTGGGILNFTGQLDLTNVTVSANRATGDGGGVYNADGLVSPSVITMTNVTLKDNGAANGGAIYNGTTDTRIALKNTVLADSTGGGNCKGKPLTSSKYSLSTDSTCSLIGTGDLNNTPALLNPLAWVGGPTRVHLPKPDSLLVGMVQGSDFPTFDQRGVSRPQLGNADSGSVERQAGDPMYPPLAYLPVLVRQ